MKKYITFIPRQQEGKLNAQIYEAVDNRRLAYGDTRFPVLPILNGYTEPGETVRVIAVCEDYKNTKFNLQYLKQELDGFRKNKGINLELKVLEVPYDDSFETQLLTFQKLIDEIEDDDILSACITYGSKPIPIVQTMVLRYAKLAKKNIGFGCVAYGGLDFTKNPPKATIYDVTPLLYVDEILRIHAKRGTEDIYTSITRMLNSEDLERS